MRKFLIIFIVAGFTFSCEKSNTFPKYQNMDVTSGFVLNNAIILSQGDCAGDELTHTYVCFVSVPADSRCPEEAECIWMGNGVARFRYVSSGDESTFFNLNTNNQFTTDTIIGGYKFTLKALNPYPTLKNIIWPRHYNVEIEIEKENK